MTTARTRYKHDVAVAVIAGTHPAFSGVVTVSAHNERPVMYLLDLSKQVLSYISHSTAVFS
jgi:hypothetical protein